MVTAPHAAGAWSGPQLCAARCPQACRTGRVVLSLQVKPPYCPHLGTFRSGCEKPIRPKKKARSNPKKKKSPVSKQPLRRGTTRRRGSLKKGLTSFCEKRKPLQSTGTREDLSEPSRLWIVCLRALPRDLAASKRQPSRANGVHALPEGAGAYPVHPAKCGRLHPPSNVIHH